MEGTENPIPPHTHTTQMHVHTRCIVFFFLYKHNYALSIVLQLDFPPHNNMPWTSFLLVLILFKQCLVARSMDADNLCNRCVLNKHEQRDVIRCNFILFSTVSYTVSQWRVSLCGLGANSGGPMMRFLHRSLEGANHSLCAEMRMCGPTCLSLKFFF